MLTIPAGRWRPGIWTPLFGENGVKIGQVKTDLCGDVDLDLEPATLAGPALLAEIHGMRDNLRSLLERPVYPQPVIACASESLDTKTESDVYVGAKHILAWIEDVLKRHGLEQKGAEDAAAQE